MLTYTLRRRSQEYDLLSLLSWETTPPFLFHSHPLCLPHLLTTYGAAIALHLGCPHKHGCTLRECVCVRERECVGVCVFHPTELIGCDRSEGESQLTLTSPLCFSALPSETPPPPPVSTCLPSPTSCLPPPLFVFWNPYYSFFCSITSSSQIFLSTLNCRCAPCSMASIPASSPHCCKLYRVKSQARSTQLRLSRINVRRTYCAQAHALTQ